MQSATGQNRVFRFGLYEADTAAGELRKNGRKVKLQEQPFRVLLLLLERPGAIVTREEIRRALWSDDTFVDFDHSLNTVVNKLRDALDDAAANPRFIETLARRGYRFIAPVEAVGGEPSAAAVSPAEAPSESSASRSALLTHPDELPPASRSTVRVLFGLIQVMYLCFYLISLGKLGSIERIVEPMISRPHWILALVLVTAVVGIPTRLYLLAGVAFDSRSLHHKFRKLFPFIFPLDELWALAPFLAAHQLGLGLAFAATAALLYLPFSQRTLMLMGNKAVR
ncbi:MAG TPA: winged helix-turn-helix domain-containing protein [Terriglobales bacterium]|nr:winged helix-turn-helix domain-containing protein [Terriglobales bacterium]